MTLQEKCFMIDLIKRNYRRRMLCLGLKMVLIIAGFSTIYVAKITEIYFLFLPGDGLLVIGILSIALANYKLLGFESTSPWKLKKIQADVIDQHAKDDFEDLINSVPLKEYFKI